MTYFLTEERCLLVDTAREFARKDVEPLASQIDRDEKTLASPTRKAAELGFFGLCIPVEYGGSGADHARTKLIAEGATEMHISMISAGVLDLGQPVLNT